MVSLGTHVASVTTDGDGWYRVAVQPDSSYSVMVRSLPNSTMHPGIGFRPSLDEDGNLRVKDFEFFSGDAEIAGRVIDRAGQPIQGARVQIGRTSGVDPSFWMGHQSESQFETDEQGFFHLRRVPSGSYALRVYQPRSNDGRPNMPIQLNVKTGTMDVEAILDTTPTSQPRRLEPKKIIPIQ